MRFSDCQAMKMLYQAAHLKDIVNHTMAMNKPWSLSSGAASDIRFFMTFGGQWKQTLHLLQQNKHLTSNLFIACFNAFIICQTKTVILNPKKDNGRPLHNKPHTFSYHSGAYLFNQGHMSDHESLEGSASFTLNLYELVILCLRHFDL